MTIIDGENEVIKSNVGDGYVQGFELEASMKIDDHTSLFGGFAYQDSCPPTRLLGAFLVADIIRQTSRPRLGRTLHLRSD